MGINPTEIISDLCDNYSWIAKRYDKVDSLFKECKNDSEILLTKDLLTKFYFVDDDTRYGLYTKMSRYIASHYNDKTVISSMTMDSSPDSSPAVVNDLKTLLEMEGMHSIKMVTRLSDLLKGKKKRKYPACTKIILVDEFCGTGSTIDNKIKAIKKDRPDATDIHVCMMAGMNYSYKRLSEEYPDVHFFFAKKLNRGILDYFSGDSLIENIQTMLHMEKHLAQNISKKPFDDYSLGYGNAQALIAFNNYRNIPNSVFPWFWWPVSSSSTQRNRLFVRYEDGL